MTQYLLRSHGKFNCKNIGGIRQTTEQSGAFLTIFVIAI
jgi:hypothetical protein